MLAGSAFLSAQGWARSGVETGEGSGDVGLDPEQFVGACELEDLEHEAAGLNDAQLSPQLAEPGVGIDDETKACAVRVFDAGEIDDNFADAVLQELGDLGVSQAKGAAESEAALEGDDGGDGVVVNDR